MKKLINDPHDVVREMLEGLVDLNPAQALLDTENVVTVADLDSPEKRAVTVISGGGAGHEPAHAGYVGSGMLTAAVSGAVFTSPSTDAVLAAIRAAAGPAGVVMIVKNYTGDRLNFGLAAEMAQAEGIPAEIVIVADDVSLRETVEPARRRGIAGTVLVHKVAGAAAAAGLPLIEVAKEARAAAANIGTMGLALDACTVPAAGKPGFELGDGEVELGLGIHGEPGVARVAMQPADAFVDTMLATIIEDLGLQSGERVVLLINGLGGTPAMELAICARQALAYLRLWGLKVERAWSGTLLSAIEMPGISLSVMRIDDARLARLDAPTVAPSWPGNGLIAETRKTVTVKAAPVAVAVSAKMSEYGGAIRKAARAVADSLLAAEGQLTDLDAKAGDGDLGISLARGAEAIRDLPETVWTDPATALAAVSGALRRAIAGSSGPFYATALLRAARLLGDAEPTAKQWAEAFSAAVNAVSELGGAQPGDRTMVDALRPAADAFAAAVNAGKPMAEAWSDCVHAAEAGVQATAAMRPSLGRAAYLGERAVGIPDAGASAVLVWLKALSSVIG